MCVSCDVQTSTTYKNVKLYPYQFVETHICVFPVSYEHHLHIKIKSNSVTGCGDL
jgi:hypothetical protein